MSAGLPLCHWPGGRAGATKEERMLTPVPPEERISAKNGSIPKGDLSGGPQRVKGSWGTLVYQCVKQKQGKEVGGAPL